MSQSSLAQENVKESRITNSRCTPHSLTTLTQFLPLWTTYLPPVDICEGIPFCFKENLHNIEISSTTYLPRLVIIVIERPLTMVKLYLQ